MQIKKISVLGGSGFVGTALYEHLSALGYSVRILTRKKTALQTRQTPANVEVIEADIYDLQQLTTQLHDCDAVINLVGILNEPGFKGKGFIKAHIEVVENILKVCRENNIQRILHMSALNADSKTGPSHYLKSKGLAEDVLFSQTDIAVTCYRPSVIFGEQDSFFNRFAGLLKSIPLFFPLACPNAKFAPVFVGDVVEFMARSIEDEQSFNQYYDLVGPEEFTLIELVRYTAKCLGLKRSIIPLNNVLSRAQATVFDFIPGKPFSMDNYLSCRRDSISQNNALSRYSITPTTIESIVPHYLSAS